MAIWHIDPTHSNVEFTVRHMMVTTVRGKFETVSGTITFDPANVSAASVEATIDASSVNTGVNDRDNHLRSADFFDVANTPNITFKSKQVVSTSDNTADIIGDLTIRGVTKEIALKAEFLGQAKNPFYGSTHAGFTAAGTINREDFGLMWNQALEAGGVLVSKEVRMELNVQAVKQEVAAAAGN